VDAKAGCLYPNNARALFNAHARGFDNALVRDVLGNVAELATSNVFMVKDGVVYTPIPNGTFLAGITRQRVIGLLRDSGITVVEKLLTSDDFDVADEIFSTGIIRKLRPSPDSIFSFFAWAQCIRRHANSIGISLIQLQRFTSDATCERAVRSCVVVGDVLGYPLQSFSI
jgi:Amino-transferase class IV